jgi:hypothetical protein
MPTSALRRDPPAILIVNDEPKQLTAMEGTLSASGYRTVCASSGREALRKLLAEDFAVILLDVRMPDLDGFETARLVRARPRSEATPIIFATAKAVTHEDVAKGYGMGAVDYLVAPFDATTLRAKVGVFVELFERTQQVRWLAADLEEGLAHVDRLNDELARECRVEADLAEKARQLEAAVAELESYDYSVAHDLRAPLRAIHGYATMLAQAMGDDISPDARGYLGRILAATRRMTELIDGLLALARAAHAEINRAVVDISGFAKEILDGLRRSAPERHVETTVQEGMVAYADPALAYIVMQNMLDNAWKFTRKRDVAHVEVGAQSEGGPPTFYVRDDGVGFAMAHAGTLFQTFRRIPGSAELEGTGIGLATVRRIIERHGGQVWAEAAPDRGATFYFTLPPEP